MVIEIAQFNCRNFTRTHFDFIATEHKQNTFLRKKQKKSSPSILTFQSRNPNSVSKEGRLFIMEVNTTQRDGDEQVKKEVMLWTQR